MAVSAPTLRRVDGPASGHTDFPKHSSTCQIYLLEKLFETYVITCYVSGCLYSIMDDNQQVRADLRKDFLHILKAFECKESTEVKLVSGETLGSTKILAFDREILQVIVAPLITPIGEKLSAGILRVTDVENVTIPIDTVQNE